MKKETKTQKIAKSLGVDVLQVEAIIRKKSLAELISAELKKGVNPPRTKQLAELCKGKLRVRCQKTGDALIAAEIKKGAITLEKAYMLFSWAQSEKMINQCRELCKTVFQTEVKNGISDNRLQEIYEKTRFPNISENYWEVRDRRIISKLDGGFLSLEEAEELWRRARSKKATKGCEEAIDMAIMDMLAKGEVSPKDAIALSRSAHSEKVRKACEMYMDAPKLAELRTMDVLPERAYHLGIRAYNRVVTDECYEASEQIALSEIEKGADLERIEDLMRYLFTQASREKCKPFYNQLVISKMVKGDLTEEEAKRAYKTSLSSEATKLKIVQYLLRKK